MDTIKQHGYIRSAMGVIGRSAVGAWWSLRRHSEYGDVATTRQRTKLLNFYMYKYRTWDNIKDYQNMAYKIMIATQYLRFFGQAAFQVIRSKDGQPLGLDFLHGLVVPNVDGYGKFKSPAFVQYPERNPSVYTEYADPRDIIFLMLPDWEGSPLGGTDVEALSQYTLPIDLYLMVAAREYMKNRDKPEVVYSLPADISSEAFDSFVTEMETRHSGAANMGRNPIAVQGDLKVTELRPLPDALPYQESRKEARDEELALLGVNGGKLGLSDYMTNANLRELRREFHETSLLPLFTFVEMGLYEQAHVREFNIPGWVMKFNNPDFLNAVEKATVHMRYWQIGAVTPNEIRYDLGKVARADELGDEFRDQHTDPDDMSVDNPQGSPPEGREPSPDDPGQVGGPAGTDADPVRGDQHDESSQDRFMQEVRGWRNFAVKRAKAGKFPIRQYHSELIPSDIQDSVQGMLTTAKSVADVQAVFDQFFGLIAEFS